MHINVIPRAILLEKFSRSAETAIYVILCAIFNDRLDSIRVIDSGTPSLQKPSKRSDGVREVAPAGKLAIINHLVDRPRYENSS